jgi:hypothetical protein
VSERADAIRLANIVLDRPNADPDDDLAMLSRQLLRAIEREEILLQMVAALTELSAGLVARMDMDDIPAGRRAREILERTRRVLSPPATRSK